MPEPKNPENSEKPKNSGTFGEYKADDKYVILDNVHGRIWMTKLERDIINTPTFQRLRRISQLGAASHVFPSATHTRFVHSLGVFALMQRMLDQPHIGKHVLPEDIPVLRIAALLHDIGHYPFSHLTESSYAIIGELQRKGKGIVLNPDIEKELPETLLGKATMRVRARGGAHHEAVGEKVIKLRDDIRTLLEDSGIDIKKVCDIIRGDYLDNNAFKGEPLSALYANLLNSDLDCDRLDYLLRDSQLTGAPYGLIDTKYLIENMRVVNSDGLLTLAIDKRHGMHALEHYVLSRYFMYVQIIYHKTVRAVEIIYKAIILRMTELGLIYETYSDIEKIIKDQEYLDFDDNYIIQKMRLGAEKDEELNELVSRFLDRKPLKLVYEEKGLSSEGHTSLGPLQNGEQLKLFSSSAKVSLERLAFEHIDLRFTTRGRGKINERATDREISQAAKLVDDSGKISFLSNEKSSVVKYLADQEMIIDRMYCCDDGPLDDESCERGKLFKTMKMLGYGQEMESSS